MEISERYWISTELHSVTTGRIINGKEYRFQYFPALSAETRENFQPLPPLVTVWDGDKIIKKITF